MLLYLSSLSYSAGILNETTNKAIDFKILHFIYKIINA